MWVKLTTSRRGLGHSSLGILAMRERVSERIREMTVNLLSLEPGIADFTTA